MMIEIKKLFKSKTILYLLIVILLISLSFSMFALNGIDNDIAFDDKLLIGTEFNFELIFYCVPIFIVFLADFVFNKDINMGTMKHLIIKSDRRKIYIYKIISLIVSAVILNIVFNLTNALFIQFKLDIKMLGSFIKASLYESLPIIEMALVFALVSMVSKKNNVVYLISLNFIILFLTESSVPLGEYTYVYDFKMAILENNLSIFNIIKIAVLFLTTYQLFKNKELVE